MKKFLLILCILLVGCTQQGDDPEPVEPPENKFATRTFHADGVWYDLPLDFKVLVEAGWFPDVIESVEEELAQTIEPKTYVQKYYIRNDRYMMAVTLYNPTDEVITIADAKVGEVEGENRKWLKDDILDFQVDKSVTFESTKDDIKGLWGEPTSSKVEGLYEVWTYEHTNVTSTTIYWSVETDTIFRLRVSNMK
ncbi:hypothetical protein AOC36_00345 [Erysipelothrix larvae]|uniref:Uncharacterized protein n=1 Tax=Erysipelothrix larvae TaxID=1514105 RepID=A0A0X8GY01_9FIRM|nr:hypothetical protein [Erysipelothrix larvae]AMC92496.1 hypothetical protein AOC36_00345 [Erysipelothrix larvae]